MWNGGTAEEAVMGRARNNLFVLGLAAVVIVIVVVGMLNRPEPLGGGAPEVIPAAQVLARPRQST